MADVTYIPARLADLTVDVDPTGAAQGMILYRGASKWQPLAVGTSGQVLTSAGAGAAPTWEDPATGGGGGVTDHGALTGLADDDHPQYHTDTRGDARYLQLAGGTVTGDTTFSAALRGSGPVTETALGIDRVDIGVGSGSPRLVFENSGYTIWQIDNELGTFRWFTPGVEQMTLSTSRFDLNQPAYLNRDVNTSASYLFTAGGKAQFTHLGSGLNDATQYAIRVQPSGTKSAYWGPFAVYLTSGATTPAMCVDGAGFVVTVGLRQTPNSLTYGTTITTDAGVGSYHRVTLTGNATLAAPTNPTDGQVCEWEFTQDGTGSRTLDLATGAGGFQYGTDLTVLNFSTAAGAIDLLRARYHAGRGKWLVTGFMRGY
jgi:hypothetical protein